MFKASDDDLRFRHGQELDADIDSDIEFESWYSEN